MEVAPRIKFRNCTKMNGKLHAPTPLPQNKDPDVPVRQDAGWAPKAIWKEVVTKRNIPAPTRNRTQPGASLLTWHVPALFIITDIVTYLLAFLSPLPRNLEGRLYHSILHSLTRILSISDAPETAILITFQPKRQAEQHFMHPNLTLASLIFV
jgi:hypothetical protein